MSILCFIVGLIFSFSPFWDSYKDYRFAYGIYKSHQEQEAKKPIREEEHSVPTDELSKRIDEWFRKERLKNRPVHLAMLLTMLLATNVYILELLWYC